MPAMKAILSAVSLLTGAALAKATTSDALRETTFCQGAQPLVYLSATARASLPQGAEDLFTKQLQRALTTHHIKDVCDAENKVFLALTVDFTNKAKDTTIRGFLFELLVNTETPDGEPTYITLWRDNDFGYADNHPQPNLNYITAEVKQFLSHFTHDWALAHP